MNYEKVPCTCGEGARVVYSGAGIYINCVNCGRDTPMQTTKTDALRYWEEKGKEIMKNRGICNLALSQIYPHPDNPRKDLGDLSEMTESVKKNGIMQNLTVIPGHWDNARNWSEDGYTLVIGHRRHAAAKKAELDKVPCRIIEGMTHKEQVSMMLEENMQRNDLTIWEQAQGFQMMLDLGDTEEQIAEKTGFSKSTVHHRLNIAKLDQSIVKEKEKDEYFQLSITDLYALEKIEDINERNRVLRESSDHRQLIYKAKNAADEEKKKKAYDVIVKMLEEQGVKPAPKKYENEQYGNKWKKIKEIDLMEKIPTEIKLRGKEQKYYVRMYGCVRIIEKNEVKEQPKSEWEVKREKMNANKKYIEEKTNQIYIKIKEFVRDIVKGNISIPKEERYQMQALWELLIENTCTVSETRITAFLIDAKHYYDVKDEEREVVRPQIIKMSMYRQMLCILMQGVAGDMISYNGYYQKMTADKVMKICEFLEQYGFCIEDDEQIQILSGTHELYIREKENE